MMDPEKSHRPHVPCANPRHQRISVLGIVASVLTRRGGFFQQRSLPSSNFRNCEKSGLPCNRVEVSYIPYLYDYSSAYSTFSRKPSKYHNVSGSYRNLVISRRSCTQTAIIFITILTIGTIHWIRPDLATAIISFTLRQVHQLLTSQWVSILQTALQHAGVCLRTFLRMSYALSTICNPRRGRHTIRLQAFSNRGRLSSRKGSVTRLLGPMLSTNCHLHCSRIFRLDLGSHSSLAY